MLDIEEDGDGDDQRRRPGNRRMGQEPTRNCGQRNEIQIDDERQSDEVDQLHRRSSERPKSLVASSPSAHRTAEAAGRICCREAALRAAAAAADWVATADWAATADW